MLRDMWTYREVPESALDLAGFEVEATDGAIGKIDEASHDVGQSYIVVDTGSWIFGKRVVLPAGTIERIDPREQKVWLTRSKDEIKGSPEYEPKDGVDPELRAALEAYYGAFFRPAP